MPNSPPTIRVRCFSTGTNSLDNNVHLCWPSCRSGSYLSCLFFSPRRSSPLLFFLLPNACARVLLSLITQRVDLDAVARGWATVSALVPPSPDATPFENIVDATTADEGQQSQWQQAGLGLISNGQAACILMAGGAVRAMRVTFLTAHHSQLWHIRSSIHIRASRRFVFQLCNLNKSFSGLSLSGWSLTHHPPLSLLSQQGTRLGFALPKGMYGTSDLQRERCVL